MNYKKLFKFSKVSTVAFMAVFCISIISYNRVLSINEELVNEIDVINARYDETISVLRKDNEELENSLAREIRANLELRNRLQEDSFAYSKEEVELLCKAVQAEAGYYEGHEITQKYVTQVILNRVNNSYFPNSIKDVIYQRDSGVPQFSVAYNGMLSKQEIEEETLNNVYEVLLYGTTLPDDVLYFYSTSVRGNWVNTLPTYKVEQNVVFAYGRV